MYIRIAFSIELRLRVSRSLRSVANYQITTRPCHPEIEEDEEEKEEEQKEQHKGEMRFFENIFSLTFFNFLT